VYVFGNCFFFFDSNYPSLLDSECGGNEASAQALLQRHVRVQEEIKAYEPEVRRLEEMTNVLVGKRRFSSFPVDMRQRLMKNGASGGKRVSVVADGAEIDESDEDSTHNDQTELSESVLEAEGRDR
jgi:hypothetical protein